MTTPDPNATRQSLLERLKHWSDQESWQTFFHRYWKLIYSTAVKSGLNDSEAQEVVQETVLSVARNIKDFNYDPSVCTFKSWMLRSTRWRILNQLEKRQCHEKRFEDVTAGGLAPGAFEQIPDPAGVDLPAIWENEWRIHAFQTAVEAVKCNVSPEQYQIFDLYVNEKWPAREVARSLEISVASVYVAKHRVSRLIRKEIERMEKTGR